MISDKRWILILRNVCCVIKTEIIMYYERNMIVNKENSVKVKIFLSRALCIFRRIICSYLLSLKILLFVCIFNMKFSLNRRIIIHLFQKNLKKPHDFLHGHNFNLTNAWQQLNSGCRSVRIYVLISTLSK